MTFLLKLASGLTLAGSVECLDVMPEDPDSNSSGGRKMSLLHLAPILGPGLSLGGERDCF